jgi:hypothetical protein
MKKSQCQDKVRNPMTGRMRQCLHPAKYLVEVPYTTPSMVCGVHARGWTKKALIPLELLR